MQTEWRIGGDRVFQPGTYIAGVLNVTPNSFYDGGLHQKREIAIERAREILTQGADILDVGGESTRPFSERVDREEELERVLPVIRTTRSEFPDRPVSVDTYKAETARQALDSGAAIVNDVTACGLDPELTDVLVQYQAGYVLMHSQGRPEDMQKDPRYSDPVEDIAAFLEAELDRLVRSGLQEERIVLDPGIGFGKRLEDNLAIMRNIERFFRLGRPVFIGQSNKSLWQKLLGLGPDQRQNATQVATALLAEKGVSIHRVHEVDLTRQTLTIVNELTKPTKEAAHV
ncbi:MAG: dihydropteroate synthase [Desulfohalobiaceae bacterium]